MEQIERALRKSREQRRTTLRHQNGTTARVRPSPVANHTQTRCVTLTPELLHAQRIVTAEIHHPVTDVYRSLRAQVLQGLGARGKTTIGVTSANHGEGKTLTAVNLAIAMAMDVNHNVLLADAD